METRRCTSSSSDHDMINQKLMTQANETDPVELSARVEKNDSDEETDKPNVNHNLQKYRRKGVLVSPLTQEKPSHFLGNEHYHVTGKSLNKEEDLNHADISKSQNKRYEDIVSDTFTSRANTLEHNIKIIPSDHKTSGDSNLSTCLHRVTPKNVTVNIRGPPVDGELTRRERKQLLFKADTFESVEETDEENLTCDTDNLESKSQNEGGKESNCGQPTLTKYDPKSRNVNEVLNIKKLALRKTTSDPSNNSSPLTRGSSVLEHSITNHNMTEEEQTQLIEKTRRSSAIIFGSPKIRNDSVVGQRILSKPNDVKTVPSYLSTRRASFAAPGVTRRRNSKIHEDNSSRTNISQLLKEPSPRVRITIDVPIFKVQSATDNQYVTYVSIIRKALLQQRDDIKNIHIIQDVRSSETIDDAKITSVNTSSSVYQTDSNSEEEFTRGHIKLYQETNMPPQNVNEENMDTGKISINDLIETMKSKQDDYWCQLRGCKHMGKFAHVETLQVLLAKQEGISCVLRAIESFEKEKELLHAACASLAHMAAVSDTNCVHIYKEEGIPLLARVLRHNVDDVDILVNVLDILGSISVVDELLESLVANSCQSLTLTTMSQHSDSSKIASQCCFIISNIASSVDTAKTIMYIGGVHVIIGVMVRFEKDKEIQENGCRALGTFASHDEIGIDVVQAGSMDVVCNALRHFPKYKEVTECACWAVACLTKYEETCKMFCDSCVLDDILHALKSFSQSEEIQEYACWTLCNIASHESTIQHVATDEVLAIVRNAMDNFQENHELQQEIFIIISQLTAGSENLQNSFVRSSGILSVVKVMESFPDSPSLQERGCNIIGNLAVNEPYRRIIESEGGSSVVIAAMLTFDRDPTIQEHGCMALINLTANVFENKRKVTRNGGVSAICSAIREFQSNTRVITCALKTLGNLVEIDEACYRLVEDDGIGVLSSLCLQHSDCTDILLLAANILIHLVCVNGLEDEPKSKGEDILIDISSKHPDNENLQLSLCQFYENMILTEYGFTRFKRSEKLERFMDIIIKYKHSYDAQMCGCKVIAAMSMLTKDIVCDDRAVDIVLNSLDHFSSESELAIVCCGALSYMTEQNEAIRELVIKSRGIDLILSAMRQHSGEDRLQVVALMSLENLQKHGREFNNEVASETHLVLEAMKRYPDNIDIQTYGCKVLFVIGAHVTIADVGTLTPVVDILKKSSYFESIKILAIAVLQSIIKDKHTYTKLKRRHSGIDEDVWHDIIP